MASIGTAWAEGSFSAGAFASGAWATLNAPQIIGDTDHVIAENAAFSYDYTITNMYGELPTLGGADALLFTWVAQGSDVYRLSLIAAADYDIPGDAAGDNIYELKIVADNGSSSPVSQDLTVEVTNVLEETITDGGDITLEFHNEAQGLRKTNAVFLAWVASYGADSDNTSALPDVLLEADSPYTVIFSKADAPDIEGQVSVARDELPKANISLFYSPVKLHVAAVPNPLIQQALRQALMDFTDESLYWQESLPVIDVSSGEGLYALALPANTLLVEVIAVKQGDVVIERGGPDTYGDYFFQSGSGQLYVKLSDYAVKLDVRVALKPSQTATQVSQTLYDNYLDAIASGAVARLVVQPGKEWSAPEVASFHQAIFDRAHAEAARITANGFVKRTQKAETNPLSGW